MSLSSLPPELVLQIIESTVPHTFHSTTYYEPSSPGNHLGLKSLQQVNLLPLKEDGESGNGRKDVVRWAVIEIPKVKSADASQEEFEETLRKFSSVANLTLSNSSHKVYDLEILELFHNLGSLHLSGQFRSLSPTQSILHIHSLTLCRGFDKLYASLLDPATVPNLRAFALGDTEWSSDSKLSAKLKAHAQLQQSSFDFALWQDPKDEYLYSKKDVTLVDCHVDNVAQALDPQQQIAHLRVYYLRRPVSNYNNECLDNFAIALKENPRPPLQSLYLDNSLSPISTLPDNSRKSLEDISHTCRELGIEILYEQTPSNFNLDPVLSPEFGARQKERVRSEAVGKVDS